MGKLIGDGNSSKLADGVPSGRLQVYEPKDFPYLHTGKSLVFTIARNGMVWGKRLDGQSSNGDVELEVFWPREDGCLVRVKAAEREPAGIFTVPDRLSKFLGPLEPSASLSQSQRERIWSILSQKEVIQYELGTLMVRPHRDWLHQPQYNRITAACKLDFSIGQPCNIKVVDCSYGEMKYKNSYRGNWTLNEYRGDEFKFYFLGNIEMTRVGDTGHLPVRVNRNMDASDVNRWYFGEKGFYAVQAERGRFDISGWQICKDGKFIKPELRIMYGEHDFFEYFAVDDAVLMLEMEEVSDPTKGLFWTLGIAQNKHVREMTRLASNNPNLFVPLLSQTGRRVSEGATDNTMS